jgi:hypothetical protein
LLAPLLTQHRLHTSEFAALCRAQIELLLAQHNREAARSWFELWQSAQPDNPALSRYQGQLARTPWSRLFGWRTGRRRER